ncbi:MAG TPA: GYF domain-containing protein [Kiritimatiellia bacterium]|nr:GYF domain-containing protein [Kiritimatiellia bacterium]HSA17216.1 GYF domain-containing protein [Kiritimatiellia bacterium]
MSWFLKQSDGQTYGPHEEDTLRQWAADGRIGADDQISQDQQHWYPAPDLVSLEMDWMIRLPDGSLFGPVHLKAIPLLAQSGEVSADAEIVNRRTAQVMSVQAALVGGAAESAPPPQATWKDLAQSRDFHDHEARKWKNLYEQERDRAAQTETGLSRKLAEMRESELSARVRLEQAERQLARLTEEQRRLEAELEQSGGSDPRARAMTWMKAYQDLSARHDSLMAEFAAKTREIQEARETCARVEEETQLRLRHMESVVQREREEAQQARKRLAEVEDSHLQLVKSYRELNDRYIRAREQAAPASASAPDSGPRIKLTR